MSDKFYPISIEELFKQVKNGFDNGMIFGIPETLWFKENIEKIGSKQFSKNLSTPLGVAAGPHTQLSQNIIAAWLTGARYIELKTVQTLDEIEVSKPCIDMQDIGYNCEWSQELKIEQSFHEYCNAWILLHILQYMMDFDETGFIFNMSVGYNLEGILNNNIQWFFSKMNNAKEEIEQKISALRPIFPEIDEINIPNQISDNITLSTMHGCPPDEIERIGLYLINEKKLHTYIKLNPTLLGAEKLRTILNNQLEHTVDVPDIAFEHDLKYPDALSLINTLQNAAKEQNVDFGLKLTNTLENVNIRDVFDESQNMMYMSGRALHPISINVARMLQNEFNGALDISFCGGVDAFNFYEVLACGLTPITVSSDLLKPGGYGRLLQYIEILDEKMTEFSANSIDELITKYSFMDGERRELALKNLNKYASKIVDDQRYKRPDTKEPNIKTDRELTLFDCISAPCSQTCPSNQDIPSYIFSITDDDLDAGFDIIMQTNPFPNVTGMVCDHSCQTKCTRVNYDDPLKIRELKRYISENKKYDYEVEPYEANDAKVAILGAGPSGLSCAWYLRLAGFNVTIFEKKSFPGGMVTDAIPAFRLDNDRIAKDIDLIKSLGVKFEFDSKINKEAFEKIRNEYDYVYVASGAQLAIELGITNSNCIGVLNPLTFLSEVRNGTAPVIGKNVCVLGGGNTAMDAARTAKRLTGNNGSVTVLYRRTKHEMPAEIEEIHEAVSEGIELIELVTPYEIKCANGKLSALVCLKNELGPEDDSGRRKPVCIESSEFELKFDTIIPAFGQKHDIDYLDFNKIKGFNTQYDNVFIGGDARLGASTVIKAVADGKNTAWGIITNHTGFKPMKTYYEKPLTEEEHITKRAKRTYSEPLRFVTDNERMKFAPVIESMSKRAAIIEAQRCLVCDEYCSICVSVCPNRANVTYSVNPQTYPVYTIAFENDEIMTLERIYEIEQEFQVLNIADFCNECGNCNTFCPTSGAPYKNKPKIHLSEESFNNSDIGYYMIQTDNSRSIAKKYNTKFSKLTRENNTLKFENQVVTAFFDSESLELIEYEIRTEKDYSIELREVIEMNLLLNILPEIF